MWHKIYHFNQISPHVVVPSPQNTKKYQLLGSLSQSSNFLAGSFGCRIPSMPFYILTTTNEWECTNPVGRVFDRQTPGAGTPVFMHWTFPQKLIPFLIDTKSVHIDSFENYLGTVMWYHFRKSRFLYHTNKKITEEPEHRVWAGPDGNEGKMHGCHLVL